MQFMDTLIGKESSAEIVEMDVKERLIWAALVHAGCPTIGTLRELKEASEAFKRINHLPYAAQEGVKL